MRIPLLAMALSSCLVAGAAHAVLTQTSFAADSFTFTANCAYDASGTACGDRSDFHEGTRAHWSTGASASIEDARGSAWTRAEADTGSYLPVLKAYASSNPAYESAGPYGGTSTVDGTIWGVQGYRYTGSTPFNLTLTATLDSQFSGGAGGGTQNHSMMAISLFDTANYVFDYDQAAATFSGCPMIATVPRWGCATLPDILARDQQFLYDTGTLTVSLSTILMPGQSFYVGAMLDANVCCGGTVDSSHTLRMQFNDATLLESFPVTVVPEPHTWAMMLGGLALLGASLRRQRR
ncbi:PEPxxWA-CTERM sorting domain-containing protein [Pseudoduganella sp. SL102]|uniref:PEPxxWA-CTERM sorting domain-containing protein n=1 Tax=Pseudoduganella sp. SL102 TaxID=2995154 RepID=UPI00248BDD20|nr:PEPxxWA-CTERM sorting domain-containing protein [Pseudoduganella sp. SL102]WBS05296.1 PEPxxWA-CTERM sorting domain-containing protein [Pseudoduganella sp. SL102]